MKRFVLVAGSFVVLLMLCYKITVAQEGVQANVPKEAKITGIVKDASSSKAIGYASIAVYNAKDSTLLTGALSKTDGSFTIEKLPYGKFYVVIHFIGYKKHTVTNILLTPERKTASLGVISVNVSAIALKGAEVVGNIPPVTYEIDKKVINIEQNIAAAGGTLAEALQNAPSIQTDVEGNITLRGSSNFTVYIDGRPSPVSGSEALQQMPASLVERVEIITNPSAKYDAEGSAGILNIITKKQKVRGKSGILNLTAGTGDKYSGNLSLNYKINKFNFTLGGDFTDNRSPFKSTGNITDTLSVQLLKRQVINGSGNQHRQGHGLNVQIDYTIDDNNTLTFTGRTGDRTFTRSLSSTYHDQYSQSGSTPIDIYYLNSVHPEFRRNYNNLNLDYVLKLNDKGQKFSAAAYFTSGPSDNVSILRVDTTDANWIPMGKNELLQQSAQNSSQTELRTKADYELPFSSKSKLAAGYQGRYLNSTGQNQVLNYVGNTWVEDISKRDKIDFKDQIQAGYVTFSDSINIFEYQVGLRTEYEDRVLNQEILNKIYKLNRIDLFPSIYLTKQLSHRLQLQANYSRRINRPSQFNINPFIVQLDPQTIRQGNPGLQPEFTNSFELNLEKKLKKDASYVSLGGFLRQTSNLIQQISIFDPATQITNNTFANIDHDRSMGAEFMVYVEPFKKLTLNTSLNVFNYHLFGTPVPGVANSINTWNFHFSPTYKVSKLMTVQLNYTYNAPSITAQGTRSGFYTSSLGIKKGILKRKGNLTLQVRNLFGPTDFINTTQSRYQYKYNSFQREPQVFLLTFNYSFNNYKVRQSNRRNREKPNEEREQEFEEDGY